jgi:hypothetical protein
MLDSGVKQPLFALETLIAELRAGEHRPELWDQLHAVADRDHQEIELAAAYETVTTDRRLSQLELPARAELLMHAANFRQGIVGDAEGAAALLARVLAVAPDNLEAFSRLERKYSTAADRLRLLDLYAQVAAKPPRPAEEIARAAIAVLVLLLPSTPLGPGSCKRLLSLGCANLALVDALVSHCRKTGRVDLACDLLDRAMVAGGYSQAVFLEQRRRLVDMYLGPGGSASKAIGHVEEMLRADPMDAQARAGAERLLSQRDVASRAAAALHEARRRERGTGG